MALSTLNFASVVLCLLTLTWASYWDVRRRTVGNGPWLLLIAVAAALTTFRFLSHATPNLLHLLYSVVLTAMLCYLFFRLGLFGGADAKALICISLLLPAQPRFHIYSYYFPVLGTVPPAFPFALGTLLNTTILALGVPIFLFFLNLFRLGFRELKKDPSSAFIGYKVAIDNLPKCRHIRLVHHYEEADGNITRRFRFGGEAIDEELTARLKDYHCQGKLGTYVWVTPDLPFMVFITLGFLSASLLGVFPRGW
jgi:preflagellin peptidase FlaK